jgi:hypothetical protein
MSLTRGVAVAVAVALSKSPHAPLMDHEIGRLSDMTFWPLPVCVRAFGGRP